MQVVINIPDEAYALLKSKPVLDNIAESIIANGTPLPKEHGRLIDINSIESIMLEDSGNRLVHTKGDAVGWFIEAPTIIDAKE